jgi:hypothetical protein
MQANSLDPLVDTERTSRKIETGREFEPRAQVRRALEGMHPAHAVAFLGQLIREQAGRIPIGDGPPLVHYSPRQDAEPLTRRQRVVYEWVASFMAQNGGMAPTLREIAAGTGIGSTNGVNDHLRALERKGAIVRCEMKSRGIRLLAHSLPEKHQ